MEVINEPVDFLDFVENGENNYLFGIVFNHNIYMLIRGFLKWKRRWRNARRKRLMIKIRNQRILEEKNMNI